MGRMFKNKWYIVFDKDDITEEIFCVFGVISHSRHHKIDVYVPENISETNQINFQYIPILYRYQLIKKRKEKEILKLSKEPLLVDITNTDEVVNLVKKILNTSEELKFDNDEVEIKVRYYERS